MEVFEIINNILNEKNMTKREFAQRLISLEPKSNRTGEIISENIVYSYLSGHTAIKAYLIPYVSDVLGVPEQLLFEENQKVRKRLLQHLSKNLTTEEYEYLNKHLKQKSDFDIDYKLYALLKFAPKPLLDKFSESLQKIKQITQDL